MNKKKVFVALSGGIDSSVSAALLLKEGYDTAGVTMIVNPFCPSANDDVKDSIDNLCRCFDEEAGARPCARRDAAIAAENLGIQHHIIDLRDKFKRRIIDYFASEYYKGKTPNPCVICNPAFKFGELLDYAVEQGADAIATGHYVRIEKSKETGLFELLRGADPDKDQAYSLYRLNQKQLSKIIFPLGGMKKAEVRKIAAEMNLPSAQAEESQEICFIEDDDYIKFLEENYPQETAPGPIITTNGEILGEHKGIIYYTVGQRKRLGISHPKPLYVKEIDFKNNAVIVGYWEELFNKQLIVEEPSWISGAPTKERRVFCKIRYRHDAALANIEVDLSANLINVEFDEPQRAITPGQSAVFYSYPDGEKVLGGGFIKAL